MWWKEGMELSLFGDDWATEKGIYMDIYTFFYHMFRQGRKKWWVVLKEFHLVNVFAGIIPEWSLNH